jgi:hypothetical protein
VEDRFIERFAGVFGRSVSEEPSLTKSVS